MNLTKEQKLIKEILQEAWENESFKNELIKNPIATIERQTGEKIIVPDNKSLVVVDQSNTEIIYFNIPVDPSNMDLTEKQLEAIAGGKCESTQTGWYPYLGTLFNL